MPSILTHIHARPDDEITITARYSNGHEWVTLNVGTADVTVFPAGDAVVFLDHLAREIAAARETLVVSKPPAIAEPTPVQAGA